MRFNSLQLMFSYIDNNIDTNWINVRNFQIFKILILSNILCISGRLGYLGSTINTYLFSFEQTKDQLKDKYSKVNTFIHIYIY